MHPHSETRTAQAAPDASAPAERDAWRAIIEAALPIARERASLIAELRGALEGGDERRGLALAYRLVGLAPP